VRIMAGESLASMNLRVPANPPYVAVKESVFPFDRFEKADIFLRPEMRSTGEVMGIAETFGNAVMKAFEATGVRIATGGRVFLSVNDNDKARIVPIAENLHKLGYALVATHGTAETLSGRGIPVQPVLKVSEGRPNVVDDIKNGAIQLIINTPLGHRARQDEYAIGWTAIKYRMPFITTLSAAEAIVRGLRANQKHPPEFRCLQDYHRLL